MLERVSRVLLVVIILYSNQNTGVARPCREDRENMGFRCTMLIPVRNELRDGTLFFWRGGGGGGGNEKSLSANFFLYLCTSANNFFLTTPSCKQFFFDIFNHDLTQKRRFAFAAINHYLIQYFMVATNKHL